MQCIHSTCLTKEVFIIFADDEPTRSQLKYLSVGGKQLRICQIMGSDWKEVANALGLDYYFVENVAYDTRNNDDKSCLMTFEGWLDEIPSEPTWKRLIEALKVAGHDELAKQLMELLSGEMFVILRI